MSSQSQRQNDVTARALEVLADVGAVEGTARSKISSQEKKYIKNNMQTASKGAQSLMKSMMNMQNLSQLGTM